MALTSVRVVNELEGFYVLAPERYDPRRGTLQAAARSVPLRKLVTVVKDTVVPAEADRACLVLDTSDAHEGIVVARKAQTPLRQIGSAKKVLAANDVIISRLRPYLRQVAFVDAAIPNWQRDILLLCSTEFFVLRPVDGESVAFLVPFLLSAPVQEVLAASQEGGHHPRFNEGTLLGLPVPKALVKDRDAVSKAVAQSVELYRTSESGMISLVKRTEALLGGRRSRFGNDVAGGGP